jgi:mRNA interferase RelE/StbE
VEGPGYRGADDVRARRRGPAPPEPARGSLRVDYDERAIGQAAALLDDPPASAQSRKRSTDWPTTPAQPGRFLPVTPDLRRLRVGRYRIRYEITGDTIAIRHIARGTGN